MEKYKTPGNDFKGFFFYVKSLYNSTLVYKEKKYFPIDKFYF